MSDLVKCSLNSFTVRSIRAISVSRVRLFCFVSFVFVFVFCFLRLFAFHWFLFLERERNTFVVRSSRMWKDHLLNHIFNKSNRKKIKH